MNHFFPLIYLPTMTQIIILYIILQGTYVCTYVHTVNGTKDMLLLNCDIRNYPPYTHGLPTCIVEGIMHWILWDG